MYGAYCKTCYSPSIFMFGNKVIIIWLKTKNKKKREEDEEEDQDILLFLLLNRRNTGWVELWSSSFMTVYTYNPHSPTTTDLRPGPTSPFKFCHYGTITCELWYFPNVAFLPPREA